MKLLLDTHVLLWWLDNPALLSSAAVKEISDPTNEPLVSVAVVWEIVIKSGLGKLQIPANLGEVIAQSGFGVLPIEMTHVWKVGGLSHIHRDPFDRILVAQALVENATLVTRDPQLAGYSISVIPA